MSEKTPQIEVFDTTLRDGEQTPGLSFSFEDKLRIAEALSDLGVSMIEAGFPVSSKEEKQTVREVQKEAEVPVCALARIRTKDIDEALETGVDMIHVFASTSDVQIDKSMNMNREEVLEKSVEAVEYVKENGRRCMFSPMDATRTDEDYLLQICKMVDQAGADIINIPDTVGVAKPNDMRSLLETLRSHLSIPFSVHCHNDFGLAVANSLAAVEGGARQVQVTINGIGERAGNASLEETVMGLECLVGYRTPIAKEDLFKVSKLVERLSGMQLPRTKPIVGNNAFSHESGIHAAGVLQDEKTFEPGMMSPETVGHRRKFVVGKHAGRKGLKKVLQEAGLEPTEKEIRRILEKAKTVSNKGKQLAEADLYAIAETEMNQTDLHSKLIETDQVFVMTGDKATPTATVEATVGDEKRAEAATGVGPVDAVFHAVKRLIGQDKMIEIVEFHIDAITGGSDAMANVTVGVEDEQGISAEATGTREDIVLASVEALVNAINHLSRKEQSRKTSQGKRSASPGSRS